MFAPLEPSIGQESFVASADLAFVGVDVLTMEDEDLLSDQTVLVDGRRLTALGPRSGVAIPPEARVVDGQRRILMPGLVDAHVHLRRADAEALQEYLQRASPVPAT